jgi:hypothetical protein
MEQGSGDIGPFRKAFITGPKAPCIHVRISSAEVQTIWFSDGLMYHYGQLVYI